VGSTELLAFIVGAVCGAVGLVALLKALQRDVNGLGRKILRTVACELRCVAEEDPISKAKLLHLADLIDPR
jgi:hypothetical protein